MRLNPGDLVSGKYRIVRLIGDGGMGAVYEARHEVLGSRVALKFLHSELTKKGGLASRFLQEAKVSASIQSPHVTRVTDVDTASDGSPYLVMELLSGESLQQLLDRRSKLPRDQAIDFALQVLSGLEAAHALGVVHRDLKPDNVYVTPSSGGSVVKLLDFGIAKLRESNEFQRGLTRPGALMGTPEYMAPEQLYAADRVDHRADLYSLGAMLYEMLTGQRPAYGEDAAQIVSQVAAGKIKPLQEHDATLPRGLWEIVRRALSPDKNQRFASAFEMRGALAGFAGELSHAGRLAAAPAAADGRSVPEPAAPVPTVDAPALALEPGAAPQWATQKGEALPQKGGTQEAPKELIQELTSARAQRAEYVAPQVPGAGAPYPPAPYGAHAAGPYGYPQQPLAPTPYGSASGSAYGTRRKSGKLLGALIALALGVILTGAVVAALAFSRRDKDEPVANAAGTTAASEPTTIVAPETPPPAAAPAPVPQPEPAVPAPVQKPAAKPRPAPARDAGQTSADAGSVSPFPQIQLPSGFPPLPSSLPPLPSGFPQIPGFPFPTQQPGNAPGG